MGFFRNGKSWENGDGPGFVDTLVTIISPVIVVVLMSLMITGYFLLAPWGRE